MHQLGLKKDDASKMLNLPADSLMKAQSVVCSGIGGNSFFGPVYNRAIIKDDAYQYAGSKNMPRVKALMGTNKAEAALFMAGDEPLQHPDSSILKSLFGDDYPMVYKTYSEELKTFKPYDAALNVLTQYMYQMHTYRFAKALSNNGIPVWMYRFDYDKGRLGASHAAELQYVWNDPKIADAEKKQLATTMHNTWVAFIKTGNPNNKLLPQWPNYKNASHQVMLFNANSKVVSLQDVFNDPKFPSAVFVLK